MQIRALCRRLAVAFVAVLSVTAARAQTTELKVSHFLPPNHTVSKWLENWVRELAQRSHGQMKLDLYPAGQLGPIQRQFDLARNGQADVAVALVGATPGRYPLTELTNLPFVWPSAGSTSVNMSKRATELAPKYLAGEFAGLHILWIGVGPPVSFFTGRKEIKEPQDAKGLKIRFQGELNAKMLRELGVAPLQVPPGEIVDGIGKGVIDGALFSYEAAETFGLGTAAKFVTEPGFTSATLIMAMNRKRYDSLPDDLKKLIDATTGPAAAEDLGRQWDASEHEGRAYMLHNKAKINVFSPSTIEALQAQLKPLVENSIEALEKNGKPAREFLDAYRK